MGINSVRNVVSIWNKDRLNVGQELIILGKINYITRMIVWYPFLVKCCLCSALTAQTQLKASKLKSGNILHSKPAKMLIALYSSGGSNYQGVFEELNIFIDAVIQFTLCLLVLMLFLHVGPVIVWAYECSKQSFPWGLISIFTASSFARRKKLLRRHCVALISSSSKQGHISCPLRSVQWGFGQTSRVDCSAWVGASMVEVALTRQHSEA